jgi:alanyl-tRNA synthetase
MRRIEALTGESAMLTIRDDESLLTEIQNTLNSPKNKVIMHIEKLKESLKNQEKENKSLRQKMANYKVQDPNAKTKSIQGIKVLIQKVEGLNNDELRNLSDNLKQKIVSGIVILGTTYKDRVFLTTSVTNDLLGRIKADTLIKNIAPLINGGGGGRPDFAQAGGSALDNLDQALEQSFSIISAILKEA